MKKWSKKHNNCILCGSCERPHYGHGTCKKCYQDRWAKENTERIRECKLRYYEDNKDRVIRRSQVSKNGEYGLFLKTILPCCVCGSFENLQCHHKDHRGHNVLASERNNDPSNIEVMCASCHGSMHGKEALGIPKIKSKQLEID